MRRFYRPFLIVGLCGWVALAILLGLAPGAGAAPPTDAMGELVRSDQATLDALFAGGTVGELPTGFLPGRVIKDPGSRHTERASRRLHAVWQGKVFHGDGTAHNRVFGLTAVPMRYYYGESWRDGGPAIVIDYTPSRLFKGTRDEMREVAPGLFLGLTYVQKRNGPEVAMMFTLQDSNSRR
jgi:hypothetical protein